MRLLIVCPCPIIAELGVAQAHLNLAAALRARGHDVVVFNPLPSEGGMHWLAHARQVRANLRAYLDREPRFDAVDCPPALVSPRLKDPGVRWIARSTQPDSLYLWQTVRSPLGAVSPYRTLLDSGWWALNTFLAYRGMLAADVVLCHGAWERDWIASTFPGLRRKVHTYEAALADHDRAALARVRAARRPYEDGAGIRYLWVGRWVDHKGTDTLMAFLHSRITDATGAQFTIAGCGAAGERELAPLTSSGRIRIAPAFKRAELPALLAAHDAGLFTSHAEGWGLVLNEMVESGLPVYATSAGGVGELRSVLGPFVPEFPPTPGVPLPVVPDEEAFARYGARFSWDAVASRYLGGAFEPSRSEQARG